MLFQCPSQNRKFFVLFKQRYVQSGTRITHNSSSLSNMCWRCCLAWHSDGSKTSLLSGTNGAVSVAGTLASAVGGLLTGLGYFCAIRLTCSSALLQHSPPQWPIVVVGLIAGLTGSFIDSLLGSLFQYSGQ